MTSKEELIRIVSELKETIPSRYTGVVKYKYPKMDINKVRSIMNYRFKGTKEDEQIIYKLKNIFYVPEKYRKTTKRNTKRPRIAA